MAKKEKNKRAEGEKTKFGKILNKAAKFIPAVAGECFDVLVTGQSPLGAVGDLIKGLKGEVASGKQSPVNNTEMQALIYEAENNRNLYEIEIMKLRTDVYKAEMLDTQDARKANVEILKMGKSNWFHYFVGISIILLLGCVLYVLVFMTVPTDNRDLFNHFVGIIEGAVLTVFTYEFGSSKGSKQKTEMLRKN